MVRFDFEKLAQDIKSNIGFEGTVTEFAQRIGVNGMTVNNLLKANQDYKVSTVLKAVNGLGKKLDDYVITVNVYSTDGEHA